MTTTRIDVDAALIALGAKTLDGQPNRPCIRGGLNGIEEIYNAASIEVADANSVLKRLMAALHGAWSRGNVEFSAERIGEPIGEEYGTCWQTSARLRITVSSTGGLWKHRSYRMVTVATVTEDEYGTHGWFGGRGAAYVTSNDGEDATVFGGYAVGAAIAHLYFARGCARRKISSVISSATSEPAPAWHAHARGELAELISLGMDDEWHTPALIALSHATDEMVIKAVEEWISLWPENPARAKAMLAETPDDWSTGVYLLIEPKTRKFLADTINDVLREVKCGEG